MRKKNLISFLLLIFWIISLLFTSLWTYENPENVEIIKSYFEKKRKPDTSITREDTTEILANSYSVQISKILSLSEKTAFVTYDKNFTKFDESLVEIYTQNGFVIKNFKSERLNLHDNFTLQRNGGVKTVFFHKQKSFALISSSEGKCFYASIIFLGSGKEIFKTRCLPGKLKKVDFNGLGSSNIHIGDKIYITLGTPEQYSEKIANLAQDDNSMFGKILFINKKELENINFDTETKLNLKVFSKGHRTPQGLTKIGDQIFNAEHGPKGGDEINKIIKNANYGWPLASYGTKYLYDNGGKSYQFNHADKNFNEPLHALVPSVGISSLNECPNNLKKFYKMPCLMALSLYGNNLRPGRSLIIYLLDKDLKKVLSVEQIFLGNGLKLRHFVTSKKNELYEDELGSIYVVADKKGIYKINFLKFK